jgi:prephenate dehydratase
MDILKSYPGIDAVIRAVEKKEAEAGIVPVENSLEGSVNFTLDLLRHSNVLIRGEIALAIRHFLLVQKGGQLGKIKQIYSHPQALAQCRQSLSGLLPGIPVRQTGSTAEAARLAAEHPYFGAVASPRSAVHYGLTVLREDLQDEKGNVTRFLALALQDALPTGDDKTSLLLGLADRPGSLHGLLGIMAGYGLNLIKIESRPIRGVLGKYIFFLDIEGHRLDDKVAQAIKEIENKALFLKILGSYPQAAGAS